MQLDIVIKIQTKCYYRYSGIGMCIYASIYVLHVAHPECSSVLFSYMYTFRLGASGAKSLG